MDNAPVFKDLNPQTFPLIRKRGWRLRIIGIDRYRFFLETGPFTFLRHRSQ